MKMKSSVPEQGLLLKKFLARRGAIASRYAAEIMKADKTRKWTLKALNEAVDKRINESFSAQQRTIREACCLT